MTDEERAEAAGTGGGTGIQVYRDGVTPQVLIRDMLIFQLKLFLDGVKDVVLSPLAVLAVIWDLIPSSSPRGRAFYQVLKLGERYDLWLNLYRPAREAQVQGEGILEAGVHSADSLLGQLERLALDESRGVKRPGGTPPVPASRKPGEAP